MKESTIESRRLAVAAQQLAVNAQKIAWREHCDKGRDEAEVIEREIAKAERLIDEAAGIAETMGTKKFVESCRRFVSFKRCTLLG